MKPRIDPGPALLDLARAQGGALSLEQTRVLGLGAASAERLVREGRWLRLDRELFHTSPDPPGWDGLAWAGVLLGGEGARLGGTSAAFRHGLAPQPAGVTVLVPAARPKTDRGAWTFVRERPGVRVPRTVGSPPCLPVEDTVLDLCGAASTAAAVVDLVTRAVQGRATTPARLLRRLEERRQLAHRRLLRELLGDVAAGAETPLELAYLHDVERAHGLPEGERQQRVGTGRHRHDVRYRRYATVVELDGRLGHADMGRFRDMHRDNAATVAGQVTLRYGWRDVRGAPCEAAMQVAGVLAARGWDGVPRRCPRCRLVPDLG